MQIGTAATQGKVNNCNIDDGEQVRRIKVEEGRQAGNASYYHSLIVALSPMI